MHSAVEGDMVEMPIDKIVPEFMVDAEPLEALVVGVGGVHDAELIAVAHQHARDPLGPAVHFTQMDADSLSQSVQIDRKRQQSVFLEHEFGSAHKLLLFQIGVAGHFFPASLSCFSARKRMKSAACRRFSSLSFCMSR